MKNYTYKKKGKIAFVTILVALAVTLLTIPRGNSTFEDSYNDLLKINKDIEGTNSKVYTEKKVSGITYSSLMIEQCCGDNYEGKSTHAVKKRQVSDWSGPTSTTFQVTDQSYPFGTSNGRIEINYEGNSDTRIPTNFTFHSAQTGTFTMDAARAFNKNGGSSNGTTDISGYISRVHMEFANPVPANEVFIFIMDVDRRGVKGSDAYGHIKFYDSSNNVMEGVFEHLDWIGGAPYTKGNKATMTGSNIDWNLYNTVDKNEFVALVGSGVELVKYVDIYNYNIEDDIYIIIGAVDPCPAKSLDPDGDGANNYDECSAGTNSGESCSYPGMNDINSNDNADECDPKDYGDLPEGYDTLLAMNSTLSERQGKPTHSQSVWSGGSITYESRYTASNNASHDGHDDGLRIIAHPFFATGMLKKGIWEVSVNGNTGGTEVFYELRIDWDKDTSFSGVNEIYAGSIVLRSGSGDLETSETVEIDYPASYDMESDFLNVRLVVGTTAHAASSMSGAIANGEIEDYHFQPVQILPVDLVDFSVKRVKMDAVLSWNTSSEVNNNIFIIEYSPSGLDYKILDEVKGRGAVHSETKYTYTHKNIGLSEKVVYYRLIQVDNDGNRSVANVVTVVFNKDAGVIAYPVPVRRGEEVTIASQAELSSSYVVYDMRGLKVEHDECAEGFKHRLSTSNMSYGIYQVVFSDGKTIRFTVVE